MEGVLTSFARVKSTMASQRLIHTKGKLETNLHYIYISTLCLLLLFQSLEGLSLSLYLLYGCMQVLLQGMESTCKLSHAGLYLTILLQFQWTLSGLKPTANAAKWDVIGSIPDSKLAKRSAFTTVVRVIISP